jgi:glyoxylase I family protein
MKIQNLCPMLMVLDMKGSLRFYVEVLGFKVHKSAGEEYDMGWVWLTRNDLNLMLNTQYEMRDRPAQPDPSRKSFHRDTVPYLGCPNVDSAYQELLKKGLKVDPPKVPPYGMKQLYSHDPDGYEICLQ